MILGFTGTRLGMTERQRFAVSEFLYEQRPTETHSGDCKGADSQFLDSALLCAGNFPPRTHGHPCDVEQWRAFRKYDVTHPVKPPAERNYDIVSACDELLAAPRTMKREPHSGTWQTIDMAVAAKKNLTKIWPDGTIEDGSGENPGLLGQKGILEHVAAILDDDYILEDGKSVILTIARHDMTQAQIDALPER